MSTEIAKLIMMKMKEREKTVKAFRYIYLLIICHMIGDYVLQNDFIAKTKGENWYHLIIHSFLYTVPFCICFGFDYKLVWLCVSHFIIDSAKARYETISYRHDQILHYCFVFCLYGMELLLRKFIF